MVKKMLTNNNNNSVQPTKVMSVDSCLVSDFDILS